MPSAAAEGTSLGELAGLLLKLGTIAFRRRRWLTRERFLDYLGATNLIPGPHSTEIATTELPILASRGFWAMLHDARVDSSMLLRSLFLVLIGARPWSFDATLFRHLHHEGPQ